MISLRNVTKIYDNGCKALENVSVEIGKGDFVFVVGQSGAGKSTFTKLILREEVPTSGEIYVDGINLLDLKQKDIPYHRRSIGMVFQDFRLLPNKTVYENVAFAMRIVGATPRQIRRSVPNVISLVGLAHKSKAYPHELSGGEQQRVALARAIVNSPKLLIADEPTGNLDPQNALDIMNLLDAINKRGTTVIIATHAKEIVNDMKKHVIAIDGGRVVRNEEKGVYEYEN